MKAACKDDSMFPFYHGRDAMMNCDETITADDSKHHVTLSWSVTAT